MRYQPVPDYHMHTPRCHHAIGSVREYAVAAMQAGLTEIGMSDHSPMPTPFDDGWRMQHDELSDYLREVEEVRDEFAGRLIIRIGLEADFRPGSEGYIEELIAAYGWDYIIGSVHYIDDWGFDNPDDMSRWEQADIEAAYCDYFALVGQSAATGMFDIIGHPDLIKKFGHRPPEGSTRVQQAMDAMLQCVKNADCALEISSAGLRKQVGEVYPHGLMLARAHDAGIPFAFGSDAHSPGEVGHAMDACMTMLESCGIREISCFSGRKRSPLPIRHLGDTA